MAGWIWRANPDYWASEADLGSYVTHPSHYVYWSTPQHWRSISRGDEAYIYLSKGRKPGVIAVGQVTEKPRVFSSGNTAGFLNPARLLAPGWSEPNAPSQWKTGITIHTVHWGNTLATPK